jgi:hypothetical protein
MHARELAPFSDEPTDRPAIPTEDRATEEAPPDPPPAPERPSFLTVLLRALGAWPT